MIMRMWHISPLLPNAGVPVGSQRHHIKSSSRTRVVESRHAEVHSPPGEKIAHLTAELSERVACSLLFLREQKDEPVLLMEMFISNLLGLLFFPVSL